MKRIGMLSAGVALALSATSAAAQSSAPQEPETRATGPRTPLLEALLACRAIEAGEARLSCFDSAAAAFDTAERQGDVTVVDRAQARETRTRLFGLDLDTANLFRGLRQDDPVEAVETTLASARQDGRGVWIFVLADGAVWRQIDQERLMARAVPGAPVRIRQGAVGSYLLSVSGARSLRVRRER